MLYGKEGAFVRWAPAFVLLLAVVVLWCAGNVSWGLYAAFVAVLAGAGSLMFLLIHYVTGARWSDSLRVPLQGIALYGLGFGLVLGGGLLVLAPAEIYPWWSAGAPEAKRFYLTHAGIYGRLAGYSVVLFGLPLLLCWLAGREIGARGALSSDGRKRLRTLSAAGLLLIVVAGGMLAIDWVMARDMSWYSGLWPVHFWMMALLVGLAALVPACRGRLDERGRNDLGLWLLAAVLLHAYTAYSGGMLVWFARIPEEVCFFALREQAWPLLFLAGMAGLVIPFVLLLLLGRRGRLSCLTVAAWAVLGGVACEAGWLFFPGLMPFSVVESAGPLWSSSVFWLWLAMLAGAGMLAALLPGWLYKRGSSRWSGMLFLEEAEEKNLKQGRSK